MSIRIITGESASGKTEYIKKLLLEQRDRRPVLCCLPSELLVNRFTKSLVKSDTVMGIEVININNLGSHLLKKFGIPFYSLNGSQMARAVKLCVDKHSHEMEYFGPSSGYTGFIRGTASIMDELKRSAVTSSDFGMSVQRKSSELLKIDSLKKLRDYELIYTELEKIIKQSCCMDHLDQLSTAVDWLDSKYDKSGLLPYCTVIFDGFHDFTGIQLELIRVLAEKSRREKGFDLIITLTSNEIENSDNNQEIQKNLVKICGCGYSTVEVFSKQKDNLSGLYMLEAPDRLNEVRESLRWLTTLIYDKGFRPEECSLIARNMSNYHTIIEETAREFDLPVNMVSNIGLSKNSVVNSICRLVNIFVPQSDGKLQKDEESCAEKKVFIIKPDIMVRLVKDPMISWKYPVSADFVEKLWRDKCLTGEFDQWLEQAEKNESPHADNFIKFLNYLNDTLKPPEKASAAEYIKWIDFLINETSLPDNIEQGPANVRTDQLRGMNKLIDILMQIKEWYSSTSLLLGEGVKRMTFSDFVSDLSSTIEAETYRPSVLKDPLTGIFAGSPVDSRGLSFRAMAVLGMSEGEFPASQSENSFFLDHERVLINSCLIDFNKSIDLSIKSREAEHFTDLVKRSGRYLLLTRPSTTGDSVWEPSPFWEDMRKKYEESDHADLYFQFESHLSNWLPSMDKCCSKQEFLMTCTAANDLESACSFPEDVKHIRRAERVISQRDGAGDYEKIEFNGDLTGIGPEVRTFTFGKDYIWSASQLESIVKCPLMFFFSRVLKLDKGSAGKPGHDARQRGNIVHQIFQEIFQTVLEKDLDTGDKSILDLYDETVDRIMEKAPQEFNFRPEAWWNQSCLRIKKELRKGLEALMEETSGSKIEMIEEPFGFSKDKNKPLEIEFEGCENIKIRGRIDRVDKKKDNSFRVIDYKTSGSAGYSNSEFKKGKILQLPLYALALWKSISNGPVSEGFYWCRDRKRSHVLNKNELKKMNDSLEEFMEFISPAIESVKTAVTKCRKRDFTIKDHDYKCSDYCPAAEFCWSYTPSSF